MAVDLYCMHSHLPYSNSTTYGSRDLSTVCFRFRVFAKSSAPQVFSTRPALASSVVWSLWNSTCSKSGDLTQKVSFEIIVFMPASRSNGRGNDNQVTSLTKPLEKMAVSGYKGRSKQRIVSIYCIHCLYMLLFQWYYLWALVFLKIRFSKGIKPEK